MSSEKGKGGARKCAHMRLSGPSFHAASTKYILLAIDYLKKTDNVCDMYRKPNCAELDLFDKHRI